MRKVVYTAITGNYDVLKTPSIVTKDWDYVCFTDNPNLKSDIWKIRIVEKESDPIRLARRIKIRYFDWIKDYPLSIWLDGSIQINCNLDAFIYDCLISESMDVECAILKHPDRSSIREEARICTKSRICPAAVTKKQVAIYEKDGYQFDNGLVATGLIVRKHTSRIKEFCSKWHEEIVEYSSRDQLSFNYILSKNPIKCHILPFDVILSKNKFLLKRHNGRK